jgi:hypothetical protein
MVSMTPRNFPTKCPVATEARLLLTAVEGMVERLEFFEAGCWWKEAVTTIDRVQDAAEQFELRKAAGELSEKVVQAERAGRLKVAV